jgi:hypothetical protein
MKPGDHGAKMIVKKGGKDKVVSTKDVAEVDISSAFFNVPVEYLDVSTVTENQNLWLWSP